MDETNSALCNLCHSVHPTSIYILENIFFFNLLYSSYMVATGHQVFTVKLQPLDGKPITDTKYVELKVIFRKQKWKPKKLMLTRLY